MIDLTQLDAEFLPIHPVGSAESCAHFLEYLKAADEQPGTSQLLDELLKDLPHGAVVLENGAGPGQRTRDLLNRGLKVIAVEPAEDALKELRRRCPEATIIQSGVEDLDLPVGQKIDFRLDRHLYYHVKEELWAPLILKGAYELFERPHAKYLVTLKSSNTDDSQMLRNFGLKAFHIGRAIVEAFDGKDMFCLQRRTTRCVIRPKDFAHCAAIAAFMMWDRAEDIQNPIPLRLWLNWVERNLWKRPKDSPWSHNHEHWIITRNTCHCK